MENEIMDNKTKCVYVTEIIIDSGIYNTEILYRDGFRHHYNSLFCKIGEVRYDKDNEILQFSLIKPSGAKLAYAIVDELRIGSFMSDVVGYIWDNPNPQSWMKTENMKGKNS